MKIIVRLALASALSLIVTGCADFQNARMAIERAMPVGMRKPEKPENYWRAEKAPGSPSIAISLSEQRAYFFKVKGKRKTLIGSSTISTGRKGFETPPGNYKVIQKDADHVSKLYGDYVDDEGEVVKRNVDVTKDPMPEYAEFRGAPMPYFLRFTRGYGLHAGYLPGYRASHGCIRMPHVMAKHFFDAAQIGTPVHVRE
jgi:lipoprotein-anchoring transpeptidase ErfK/SrfK